MKIKQIGNGSAFNYKETNSSFLIENHNKYIVFDCGHSVYTKLRQLEDDNEISLKNLKSVYISHFDDDHIGSLKTLIYYQYFINNIIMDIIIAEPLYNDMLVFLKDLNGYYNIYSLTGKLKYDELILESIECDHHVPCYGLVVQDDKSKRIFIITGDTRAIKYLDAYYVYLVRTYKDFEILVFHDYSNWNEPSKQVHMCLDDMNNTYHENFIKILNFYHNDEIYIKEWR